MSPTVSTQLEGMTQERNGWRIVALLALALFMLTVTVLLFAPHCPPQPCVQPKADDPWQVPGPPADLPEGM